MMEKKIFETIESFCNTQEICADSVKELTKRIMISLMPPARRKVYDSLTGEPKSVSELSCETLIPMNTLSATLDFLYKQTTLVSFSKHGKNKRWYKS